MRAEWGVAWEGDDDDGMGRIAFWGVALELTGKRVERVQSGFQSWTCLRGLYTVFGIHEDCDKENSIVRAGHNNQIESARGGSDAGMMPIAFEKLSHPLRTRKPESLEVEWKFFPFTLTDAPAHSFSKR